MIIVIFQTCCVIIFVVTLNVLRRSAVIIINLYYCLVGGSPTVVMEIFTAFIFPNTSFLYALLCINIVARNKFYTCNGVCYYIYRQLARFTQILNSNGVITTNRPRSFIRLIIGNLHIVIAIFICAIYIRRFSGRIFKVNLNYCVTKNMLFVIAEPIAYWYIIIVIRSRPKADRSIVLDITKVA